MPDPSNAVSNGLFALMEPMAGAASPNDGGLDLVAPRAGGWRRSAEQRQNQDDPALKERHKRIVVCADGTWNTPRPRAGGSSAPTNVWLLYQVILPVASDQVPQLALYHAGVGTGGLVDRLLGGAFGVGLRDNILDCYRFLVDYYHPGDALYLFGFSRGAYTVRSLAGLIRNCGIIDRRGLDDAARDAAIDAAFQLYRKRGDDTAPAAAKAVDFRARHSHPDFRITCIGVWDTVGALGIPVGLCGRLSRRLFGFHDVTLSSRVDRAFHAIAVDERRRPFVPTLWHQQPDASKAGQVLEQVWFTGVHSDVGGGYGWDERDLANLTLRWMANRVTARCCLELDTGRIPAPSRRAPELHDSFKWFYRVLGRAATRCIDGGLGRFGRRDPFRVTSEALHPSVDALCLEYASRPMPLVDRSYTPANVADYGARKKASLKATSRATPNYPRDVR